MSANNHGRIQRLWVERISLSGSGGWIQVHVLKRMTVTWPPPGPVAPQTPTLEGNALEASDYAIRFGENTPRTTVCAMVLDADAAQTFQQARPACAGWGHGGDGAASGAAEHDVQGGEAQPARLSQGDGPALRAHWQAGARAAAWLEAPTRTAAQESHGPRERPRRAAREPLPLARRCESFARQESRRRAWPCVTVAAAAQLTMRRAHAGEPGQPLPLPPLRFEGAGDSSVGS